MNTAQSCFLCTTSSAAAEESADGGQGPGSPEVHPAHRGAARPMNVRQVDDAGNLWFLSASDSHKNAEIQSEPSVRLFFQGPPHSDFLELKGTASISRDRAKIAELWEPVLRTWFTGGVDDPRITAIKVVPTEGYYWDTKHGNFVAGIKMMVGAMIGQTLDDSIEGRVRV